MFPTLASFSIKSARRSDQPSRNRRFSSNKMESHSLFLLHRHSLPAHSRRFVALFHKFYNFKIEKWRWMAEFYPACVFGVYFSSRTSRFSNFRAEELFFIGWKLAFSFAGFNGDADFLREKRSCWDSAKRKTNSHFGVRKYSSVLGRHASLQSPSASFCLYNQVRQHFLENWQNVFFYLNILEHSQ